MEKVQRAAFHGENCALHPCVLFNCASLLGGNLLLAYAAEGADEIFRDVFKGSAGGNAALGTAGFGVVFPAADGANVLFHNADNFGNDIRFGTTYFYLSRIERIQEFFSCSDNEFLGITQCWSTAE